MLTLSDFDYELPQKLIAQYPTPLRDSSRMLILKRRSKKIIHANFKVLSNYIKHGDVLVLNDTKVTNARLIGKRPTGGKVEIFLLESIGENKFKALIRPSHRIKEAERIGFDNSELEVRLLVKKPGENIIEFSSQADNVELDSELKKIGYVPLPPYIKRLSESIDSERYQTIYAKKEGATAAPTAGLHFTEEILKDVMSKGAKLSYVTLHVSYGTFAPVRVEDITKHRMHSESFELTEDAATEINNVKKNGGRVFAVGTTSCRVLETCAGSLRLPENREQKTEYRVKPQKGKTNLFIHPSYKFRIVDALLTNFHLPKSTLLMLACAFAGRELIFKAYREAIEKKYRFFSYGDCMLIL